jgi:hypothetical protein
VRDALAHRFDDAGAFHAQLQRHRQLVQAGALVDVDEVQADGLVADADLAGAGLADLDVDDLHLLGAAMLVGSGRLCSWIRSPRAVLVEWHPATNRASAAIHRRRRLQCRYSPHATND